MSNCKPTWLLGLNGQDAVFVSLRSSQSGYPQDILRPFKAEMLGLSPAGIMLAVAQMEEQWIVASQVAGSNPSANVYT